MALIGCFVAFCAVPQSKAGVAMTWELAASPETTWIGSTPFR